MTPADDADARWMRRVQTGDAEAFEALVEKYRQPVMNFVTRLLRDADEAEDVAQATFVQVFKCAGRFDPSARFSTWLFTIAHNLARNELRRRARHPADSMDAMADDHEELPARQFTDIRVELPVDGALHSELLKRVEVAIGSLPPQQRAALLLCREDVWSYEEIAQVLGCSVPATKSIIHRGRETLKRVLKPYLACSEPADARRKL